MTHKGFELPSIDERVILCVLISLKAVCMSPQAHFFPSISPLRSVALNTLLLISFFFAFEQRLIHIANANKIPSSFIA